jgi:hypothetical protein
MIRPASFTPEVRAQLRGYGFDWRIQENIANQIAFKLRAFRSGTVFAVADCGIGMVFEIVNSTVVRFRFAANPHEFDAEGCQER